MRWKTFDEEQIGLHYTCTAHVTVGPVRTCKIKSNGVREVRVGLESLNLMFHLGSLRKGHIQSRKHCGLASSTSVLKKQVQPWLGGSVGRSVIPYTKRLWDDAWGM